MRTLILSFGFGGEQVAISIEIHKEIRRRVEAHLLNLGFAFSRTSLEAGPPGSMPARSRWALMQVNVLLDRRTRNMVRTFSQRDGGLTRDLGSETLS